MKIAGKQRFNNLFAGEVKIRTKRSGHLQNIMELLNKFLKNLDILIPLPIIE
jgi:hypothetical protein